MALRPYHLIVKSNIKGWKMSDIIVVICWKEEESVEGEWTIYKCVPIIIIANVNTGDSIAFDYFN